MILFNSVSQFEIQAERTKRRVKRNDLDTLTEVWTGPSAQEDTFVPHIGSAHPQYNLMTVIDTSIKRIPADVAEVTINYQGKLDGSGQSGYTSVPTISQSWMEGEVSYQQLYSSGSGVATQQGTATYSRRYTGRCCELSYLTNRRPSGNPTQLGLAKDYLGFTNVWQVLSSFQAGLSVTGGQPILQMVCTDVKVEDKADGWYRVAETYQSRQYPGAVYPITGSITVTTTLPTTSLGGANWDASEAAAIKSQAAAQAASYGIPLPVSPPGSWGAEVAQQTGIDPAQLNVAAAIPAAAASPSFDASGVAAGSQPLPF